MATHSSVLAWRIPWTEEPGGLPSMGRTESDTTEVTWQQQQQSPVVHFFFFLLFFIALWVHRVDYEYFCCLRSLIIIWTFISWKFIYY